MKDAYESIPFMGKYDMRAPQIACNSRQLFWREIKKHPFTGIFRSILYGLKRKYGQINESDVDINSDYELRPDGSRSMNIPIRFIKRIPNPKLINTDVLGCVIKFHQMALNFNEKSR